MRKYACILLTSVIVASGLVSCQALQKVLSRDELAASVGDELLYRREVESLIPKGVSSSDSLNMARSYIQAWAKDNIYIQNAQKYLSKADLDVTKELEDYRKGLLKYRYEQLFVNERLDTAITEEQIQSYYDRHKGQFISSVPLVRARFLSIDKGVKTIYKMRPLLSSQILSDLEDLSSQAFDHDAEFTYFNDEWISAEVFASHFDTNDYNALLQRRNGGYIDITKGNTRYIAYVCDYLPPQSVLPVEMCQDEICDLILSERKNQLLNALEQDLLETARRTGKYKIY